MRHRVSCEPINRRHAVGGCAINFVLLVLCTQLRSRSLAEGLDHRFPRLRTARVRCRAQSANQRGLPGRRVLQPRPSLIVSWVYGFSIPMTQAGCQRRPALEPPSSVLWTSPRSPRRARFAMKLGMKAIVVSELGISSTGLFSDTDTIVFMYHSSQ
ncbi:hypothetical protein B0I37DRAFT_161497 [Chaetomium sp. MPI-CAGE-AT-0009]|nr:hypothetical protein B0I37DRAFT_161497 [Chaetomium sp. MPI-CAGE-AT-0009]